MGPYWTIFVSIQEIYNLIKTTKLCLKTILKPIRKKKFFSEKVFSPKSWKIFHFKRVKDVIPLSKSVLKFEVAIKVILLPPAKKWRYYATPCLWKRDESIIHNSFALSSQGPKLCVCISKRERL